MFSKGNKQLFYMFCIGILLTISLVFAIRPHYAAASSTGWDEALKNIDQLYDSLVVLETSNKLVKQQTLELRKQNNDKLKAINERIKLIDKVRIDNLNEDVLLAQKKHAPLLTEYDDLGKKAAAARKSKNTKSALMYDLKRNRIKGSAAAARQEIKGKKDALAAVKKQASAKSKVVKDALLPVQSLKKQITAENKKIADANKVRISADKRYKAAIKQGNAITAALELKLITGELSRIQAFQKKIFEWEGSIRNTIRLAESKLPG
ncbi:hypothetical protein [Paenibacillus dakarensis]|uniref:hypothetical protein n=1 Tax=Paenibacillus dakarensis TaxID=1527293 RepID=UPI0006D57A43|nr:hypothetical protein [Paenibacillus dakarensis]